MGSKGASKDFDYNLIKILDAVISAGNAVRAAKRLSVTPAAVSSALKRLQSFYHEELFVRSKDGLIPTARALTIHQSFRQVMELVSDTFLDEKKTSGTFPLTVLGSEVVGSYYLSQLYDSDIFDRMSLNHFSSCNLSREKMKELLLTAECDVLITSEPFSASGIDSQVVDSFKRFVCVCSAGHLLSELSQLSLHHFYSSHHAIYQPGLSSPLLLNDNNLYQNEIYHYGRCHIGYCSDSVSGIMSVIERTSLIALMPLKLALFYKNQRHYDIKFVQPPPELILKPFQFYACWDKNSKSLAEINEIVTMLHTLSSFRR